MTISPAVLWGPVQLQTSAQLLGALCPVNGNQVVKRAVFTNINSVNVTITVYVSRNGAGLTNANCVIDAFSLSPGQAYVSPELANLVLGSGDGVYALASIASMVNATGSGWKQ